MASSRKRYTLKDYKKIAGVERPQQKRSAAKGRKPLNKKAFTRLLTLLAMMSSKNKNKTQRQHIIEDLDSQQLTSLRKLACDFLKKKYTVTNQQLRKLQPHRELVYILADKPKLKTPEKKRYLQQKGGILSTLVPILASIAAPALFKDALTQL